MSYVSYRNCEEPSIDTASISISGIGIGGLSISGLSVGSISVGGLSVGSISVGGLSVGSIRSAWHQNLQRTTVVCSIKLGASSSVYRLCWLEVDDASYRRIPNDLAPPL